MHSRRVLAFLIGVWFAGTGFLHYTGYRALATADQIAAQPPHEAQRWLLDLGPERTQLLLRHVAAEAHRHFQEAWANADLAVSVAIALLLLFGRGGIPSLVLSALFVVAGLANTFLLTPQTVAIGRILDFAPALPVPPELAQFGSLQKLNYAILAVRTLLLCGVTGILFLRSERSSRSRRRSGETDAVHHADHSHVDR